MSSEMWRHVERGWDKACGGPSDVEGFINCGCTTPDPDPTSPCGFEFDFWTMTDVCEMPSGHALHLYSNARMYHDYRPTLCRCGHHIEEAR